MYYIGDIFASLYSVLGRYTNTLNHTGIISPRTVFKAVKKAEDEKERPKKAFKDNFFVEVEFTLTLTADVCVRLVSFWGWFNSSFSKNIAAFTW